MIVLGAVRDMTEAENVAMVRVCEAKRIALVG